MSTSFHPSKLFYFKFVYIYWITFRYWAAPIPAHGYKLVYTIGVTGRHQINDDFTISRVLCLVCVYKTLHSRKPLAAWCCLFIYIERETDVRRCEAYIEPETCIHSYFIITIQYMLLACIQHTDKVRVSATSWTDPILIEPKSQTVQLYHSTSSLLLILPHTASLLLN